MKNIKVFIKILLVIIILNAKSFFPFSLEASANSIIDDVFITISSEVVFSDESFTAEFVFEDNMIDYYYIESGVTVVDSSCVGNYAVFELTSLDGECRFEFSPSFVDDEYEHYLIYTFSAEEMIFISLVSEDSACLNALEYLVEQSIMTLDDIQDEYSFYIEKYFPEPILEPEQVPLDPLLEEVSIAFGVITWQDDSLFERPLKETRVDLYCLSTEEIFIKTAYTNEDGEFEIIYDNTQAGLGPNCELFVKVYCESYTFKVSKYWLTTSYSIIPVLKPGSTLLTGLNYIIENDNSNIYKAFVLEQGMTIAQRYARDQGCVDTGVKKLNVAYPVNHNSMCIDLGFVAICSIKDQHYKNWYTLAHEYGHYVQRKLDILDISLWDYLFKGATHAPGADQIHEKPNKEHAMNLAYSEAWASVFSMMTYEHNPYEYYPTVSTYKDSVTKSIDEYNIFLVDSNSGEGQQAAIIAFLWDLFGHSNSGLPADSFSPLGHDKFWELTGEAGTYKLMDFVTRLDEMEPDYRSEIGTRLSYFQIAPQDFTITNIPNQSDPPTFSWIVNGSNYNPNNEFSIVFYDGFGVRKHIVESVAFTLITNPLLPYSNNKMIASYTLSQAEWDEALSQFPVYSTMNILVRGYLNSSPKSGPYWSKYYTMNAPVKYTITQLDDGVSIDGLNGKLTGNIILPTKIVEQPVVSISSDAFKNQSNITSIDIPNTVTSIGSNAFNGCLGLTIINIPNATTSVELNAFLGCNYLAITWDYNPLLSSNNFKNYLTSVEINSNVTNIANDAFKGCSKLSSITIPSNVLSIGAEAFKDCKMLTNLTLSNTITSVGSNAFLGCTKLAITWHYNPTLSFNDFKDYLTSVVINNNITNIANYAFSYCSNLTSITIPNSITSIGYEAFRDCSSLISITLPSGLTRIEDTTFWGCSSLTSIVIPDDITYIGLGAFSGCSSLTSIIIPDGVMGIETETFAYCTSLETVTIGSNVAYIDFNAFRYCDISEVVIPSSVGYIGFEAFAYCSNLKKVYIQREYPNLTSLGYDAFKECNLNLRIYVPNDSLIYYRGDSSWAAYASKINIEGLIPECGFENNYNHILTNYLDEGGLAYYIIWIVDPGNYKIAFNATNAFQIEFYDKDVNLININLITDPNNQSGYFDYEVDHSAYMHYLVIKFSDPLVSGTIVTTIEYLD